MIVILEFGAGIFTVHWNFKKGCWSPLLDWKTIFFFEVVDWKTIVVLFFIFIFFVLFNFDKVFVSLTYYT